MSTPAVHATSPEIKSLLPPFKDRVSEVALHMIKEATAVLLIGSAVSLFVAPAGVALIFQAIKIHLTASLIFQITRKIILPLSGICEWLSGLSFATFIGYNGQQAIHEAGHALSALAVYSDTSPSIELTPFGSAITRFQKGALSAFGEKIGPASATCLITLSGPLLTLFVSSVLFSVGLGLRKTHPSLSKYLISWAIFDYINTAHYAYSAIGNRSFNLSHDFVHLSLFGISPTAATVSIIAIPILLLSIQNQNNNEKQPNN
jgi:hypothetical protein